MTATATTDTRAAAQTVGELQQLARYTTATGTERVLGGQRVDGVVVLTDYALTGGERAYVVEEGLEQEGHGANAALNALIADYLTQIERYNDCPMHHTAVENRPDRDDRRAEMMILTVHVQGAPSYDVGDEIWQESLADAIRAEADTIADHAGPELLGPTGEADRDALRERIVVDMTTALVRAGDRFRAPDGVLYSLTDTPALDPRDGEGRLDPVAAANPAPIVEKVLRFENLPPGSLATRRAVVRWSDGTESEALNWYSDEILICEGDLLGKTQEQLRSLHFHRDRDWLQS
jgi:hypothetical protein